MAPVAGQAAAVLTARRLLRGLRAAVVAAATALLLAACQLPPTPQVLRLASAESAATGAVDAAPARDAVWLPTPLPDNWDSRRPGYEGFVRYRLRFDVTQWPDGRLGLYLPAATMNAYPIVNGHSLGAYGRMQAPVTRHFYTPLLWELPRTALKAGDNELVLVVVGQTFYRAGLAPVEIGPYELLYDAWRIRGWLQNTGTLATSLLAGSLGAYVLLLWWRERSNRVFGWFGLAALVWAGRNLNYVVTDPPLPGSLWPELTLVGAGAFQALFALFTVNYVESLGIGYRASRHTTSALLAYIAVTLLWFVSQASFPDGRPGFVPLGVIALAITAWSQWRLLRAAWRRRSSEVVAIAGAGLLYLALVLHDFAIATDAKDLGQVYLRQYASVPLFLAIGWMLTRRYLDALEQARAASASLQSQVDAQRRELEANHARLREAERNRAAAAERERVMRELHDGLGLNLVTAYEQCRRADVSRDAVAASLQDCLTDLRVAIDSLAPEERDPLAVLGSLRFRMTPRLEAVGIALRWEVVGEVPELPQLDAAQALHLLRIVQEALNNAIRHSGARSVLLRVEGSPDEVTVVVRDDGAGAPREAHEAGEGREGRGIAHMRQRAGELGGRLQWSATDRGVEVRLSIPVLSTLATHGCPCPDSRRSV